MAHDRRAHRPGAAQARRRRPRSSRGPRRRRRAVRPVPRVRLIGWSRPSRARPHPPSPSARWSGRPTVRSPRCSPRRGGSSPASAPSSTLVYLCVAVGIAVGYAVNVGARRGSALTAAIAVVLTFVASVAGFYFVSRASLIRRGYVRLAGDDPSIPLRRLVHVWCATCCACSLRGNIAPVPLPRGRAGRRRLPRAGAASTRPSGAPSS